MKPIVEIFSQGEEVVNGQTADTNAAWLSQKLVQMGFVVKRHTAVGDNLADLKKLLSEIASRADCCVCSGGLGPTVDDLTAQAVAEAFERPLLLDEVALAQIERYFACRNRDMVDANRKQAYFPKDSVRIDNAWGTAPGFALQHKRCWFAFVPGVPFEMKRLFEENIAESLLQRFSLRPDRLVTLRSVGIGESDIQQKLDAITLPENVQLSFRTGAEENQTKLSFPAGFEQSKADHCVELVADSLGDFIFSIDEGNQPQAGVVPVIGELMQENQWTLSVQETASQGLIAAKCIGQPWLLSSAFSQSLQQLSDHLEVKINSQDMFKAAADIADKIQQRDHSKLVLVQLYGGGQVKFQDKEQVIILYNVLLTPYGIRQTERLVGGPQKRKQNQAAIIALDLLRRYLQNKCL